MYFIARHNKVKLDRDIIFKGEEDAKMKQKLFKGSELDTPGQDDRQGVSLDQEEGTV